MFDMPLSYYDPAEWLYEQSGSRSSSTPSYTGNISLWKWENGANPYVYAFEYDNLGRLTDALKYGRFWGTTSRDGRFEERDITYDRNGNIKTLKRSAAATGLQPSTTTMPAAVSPTRDATITSTIATEICVMSSAEICFFNIIT